VTRAELPKFFEIAQVARLLSVSEEYVRRLIRKRRLKAIHLGRMWRVADTEVQRFLDETHEHTEEFLEARPTTHGAP
jgi:excisionase family DNA binding protein